MTPAFEIPLDSRCLNAPTRLDLAPIEAAMLWPDDASRRAAAFAASTVAAIKPVLDDCDDSRVLRDVAKLAIDFPSVETLQGDVTQNNRFVHGLISGMALRLALETKTSMGDALAEACKPFLHRNRSGAGGLYRVTEKTANNAIWPTYRPVAHFWAAWDLRREQGTDAKFPCRCDQVVSFLGLAEAYRERGEETRPFKSSNTVLRKGESAFLPEAVSSVLPKFGFLAA